MAVQIELDPRALEEMHEAYRWYFERSQSAATQFQSAIDHAIDTLVQAPERWPVFDDKKIRRYLIRHFPYSLLYTFNSSSKHVLIVAVAHQRRRPGFWRR